MQRNTNMMKGGKYKQPWVTYKLHFVIHRLRFLKRKVEHFQSLTIKSRLLGLIALLLLFSFALSAQNPHYNVENDFGLWSKVEVDQKHNKDWKSSYSFAYRRRNNLNSFRNLFFEYAVNRDLKNKFDTGSQFRFTLDDNQEYTFRFAPYLVKAYRLKPITFKYRLKNDVDIPFEQSNGFDFRSRVRNRIEAEYERKKIPVSLDFSVEWFHRYDLSSIWFSNIRISTDVKYELTKDTKIGIGYFVQQEQNEAEPVRDHVVTVDVSYKL